jgi:hypothetical protein
VDSSVRLVSQPDPTGESPVTTAKPLPRYSAVEGALASGFATAELHHQLGHDLRLESLHLPDGGATLLTPGDARIAVEGYSTDQIGYHLALLREAGLINCPETRPIAAGIGFRRLSWEGHDFLDAVRDSKIWEKTKSGAAAAGGFTMELLRDLAKGFVRKQIEEYTGVKL